MLLGSLLLFIPVLILIVYAIAIIRMVWPIQALSIEHLGSFGDTFGIITALFTALAFGGVILTVWLQREELSLQRKELAEARFNNAFFKLLDYYKTNLEKVVARDATGQKVHGIDALICQFKNLETHQHGNEVWYQPKTDQIKVFEHQLFIDVERALLRQSRYMGTLETILNLVRDEVDDEKQRAAYWKIVDSQLTVHEVKYLFYRLLVESKETKFYQLLMESGIVVNRAGGCGIQQSHIVTFEKLHGVKVGTKKKPKLKSPHDRSEVRKIKRRVLSAALEKT